MVDLGQFDLALSVRWCEEKISIERKAQGSIMPEQTQAGQANLPFPSVPAFWPMAMATTLFEQGSKLLVANLKFVDEEIKIHENLRPTLATPNRVRLDLRSMVLRDYGAQDG